MKNFKCRDNLTLFILILSCVFVAGCSDSNPPGNARKAPTAPATPPEPGVRGKASYKGVESPVADGVAYWHKEMKEVWVYLVSRTMTDEERKTVSTANMVVERMVPGAKIMWIPIVFDQKAEAPTAFGISHVERYAVSYSNFGESPYTMNIYKNQGPLESQGLLFLRGEIKEGGNVVARLTTMPKIPRGAPAFTCELQFNLPLIMQE